MILMRLSVVGLSCGSIHMNNTFGNFMIHLFSHENPATSIHMIITFVSSLTSHISMSTIWSIIDMLIFLLSMHSYELQLSVYVNVDFDSMAVWNKIKSYNTWVEGWWLLNLLDILLLIPSYVFSHLPHIIFTNSEI